MSRIIGGLLAVIVAASGVCLAGDLSGTVRSVEGVEVTDARVDLTKLRLRRFVDGQGAFSFGEVPDGEYELHVVSPTYGSAVKLVNVSGTTGVEIRLDLSLHSEEIVVSASADAQRLDETFQAVSQVRGVELDRKRQASLGETLSSEAGVSSTGFGRGSSRPVIRGLGGDRVRVLESGIGNLDASTVSVDHAAAIDPYGAEEIEIVRGPAALLYGSSAIGGLVNVLDERIPRLLPQRKLGGSVDLGYGTNAEEINAAVKLDGAAGDFAWHVGALDRDADDYEVPDLDAPLLNSAIETDQQSFGLSYFGERSFWGVSVSSFATLYGIPGEGDEGPVRIDMDRERLDLEGEVRFDENAFLRGVRVRAGSADYEHVELAGTEIGTRFVSDGWEGRVELPHHTTGDRLHGTFGLQYSDRDFAAIGDEAFVPPNSTKTLGLFAFEELDLADVSLQFGARFEQVDVAPENALALPELDFSGLSGSFGVLYRFNPVYSLAASLASTERLPTAEELFSDGPHEATQSFELGNAALRGERGVGLDVSVRRAGEHVRGELSVYVNDFDDFVFLQPTGRFRDEDGAIVPAGTPDSLPELAYRQADAELMGYELHIDIDLVHEEPHHLALELVADAVTGELSSGENLPRIPPMRWGAVLDYQRGPFWAQAGVMRVSSQDDVAPNETATPGYTMADASIGYRILGSGGVHEFILRAKNLTDELARNHVSLLKEIAPQPGRDITLGYRIRF